MPCSRKGQWDITRIGTIAMFVLFLTFLALMFGSRAHATEPEQTILTTQTPSFAGPDARYELGTKFKTSVPGEIIRVRIYAVASEGGDHTVRIWRASDHALMAGPYTLTFRSGTAGWKELTLPSAVRIDAGVDYIVAVSNSTDKHYAKSEHGFDNPVKNGNLITYTASGVYSAALGAMSTLSAANSNYFRDIVFLPNG